MVLILRVPCSELCLLRSLPVGGFRSPGARGSSTRTRTEKLFTRLILQRCFVRSGGSSSQPRRDEAKAEGNDSNSSDVPVTCPVANCSRHRAAANWHRARYI